MSGNTGIAGVSIARVARPLVQPRDVDTSHVLVVGTDEVALNEHHRDVQRCRAGPGGGLGPGETPVSADSAASAGPAESTGISVMHPLGGCPNNSLPSRTRSVPRMAGSRAAGRCR